MSATWRVLDTDTVNSLVNDGVRAIANLVRVAAESVRRRHQAARTIRRLRHLDDRLLCDIGASRASVGRSRGDFRGIGDALARFIDPRV